MHIAAMTSAVVLRHRCAARQRCEQDQGQGPCCLEHGSHFAAPVAKHAFRLAGSRADSGKQLFPYVTATEIRLRQEHI
jgi:hypothetical protein